MAEANYANLYAEAIASSSAGSEVLPDDNYNVQVKAIKPGKSNNDKFRVGICLEVLDGPHKGKSTWVNQTFSPENPKAVAVFIRILRELGVPAEPITAGLHPEQLCGYIVKGTLGVVQLSSHSFGTQPDGTPKKFQDIKKFTITGTAGNPALATSSVPAPQPEASPAPAVATPAPAPAPSTALPF